MFLFKNGGGLFGPVTGKIQPANTPIGEYSPLAAAPVSRGESGNRPGYTAISG
tara:strand:- start:6112 stop:6270 length:159 start_codon:yes stop_codon:yes gene_type:complete